MSDLNLYRSSGEVILEPHLNARGLTFDHWLEQFEALFSRRERELKRLSTFRLTLNRQVLNRHLKLGVKRLVALTVKEIECRAHRSIEELVVAVRMIKWISFLVVQVLGALHHLLVSELALVCHVLQTILAARLSSSQDHNVISARRDTHQDVVFFIYLRVYDLEAFKRWPHSFGHLVWRVVLGVDEAIPAVQALNVGDSGDVTAVVCVVLEIVRFVFLWCKSLGRVT